MKLLMPTAIIYCGVLVAINTAFGQTWTKVSSLPNADWSAIAISPDGKILVASDPGSSPSVAEYTSTNSGVTWIGNNVIFAQAVSSLDGTKWFGAGGDAEVFISTNSGVSWIRNYDAPQGTHLACSASGNIVVGNEGLVSKDSGQTWRLNYQVDYFRGYNLFLNNGMKWVTVGPGGIYTSLDQGVTWITNNVPSPNMFLTAASADGTKLVSVDSHFDGITSQYVPGPLYLTTNSGVSWFKAGAPTNYWTWVASSSDGNTLIAAANSITSPVKYNGSIYTSTNGGLSWVSNSLPVGDWTSVSCSSDGSELAAAAYGGGIYTSFSKPSSQLNIASSSSSNLTLSWYVPSTNFSVQQSSDLTTTNWVTLTNTPTLNLTNEQEEVILSPSNNSAFYRLKTP